jgi:hypothetical protein
MCPSKGAHSVMGFLIYRGTFRLSRSLWQGRYYSCPLDQTHLWEALRYTELNPVRAGLASDAGSWKWSTRGGTLRPAARGRVVSAETVATSLV